MPRYSDTSYKPPFARRLGRTAGNKPAPRGGKKDAAAATLAAYGGTSETEGVTNVIEALEAIGKEEIVTTVTDTVVMTDTARVTDFVVEAEVEAAEWSMLNKKAELLTAAGDLGLTVDSSMTKATILEAITGAV